MTKRDVVKASSNLDRARRSGSTPSVAAAIAANTAKTLPENVEKSPAQRVRQEAERTAQVSEAVQREKDANAARRAAATAGVPRGQQPATRSQTESLLIGNLNTDLANIYQRTVAAFAPAFRSLPPPIVLRSPENAVLMFRVNGRREAKQMWKRLEKCVVYGRKWRPVFAPAAAVTPSGVPTAVDVTMSAPPLLPHQVEAVLGTMPGLLAVTAGDGPQECVATFADEGSALHARAVLSGRRQQGCHLFLTIRRDVTLADAGLGSDGDEDGDADSDE